MSKPTPNNPAQNFTAKKLPKKDRPERQWHRRPGQKIDDLLLKRHQHSSQRYTPLARLIQQSDQRNSLTQAVRALLPEDLRATVEVVNFRAPSLVLRCGNASIATRLRYSLPNLTNKLLNLADFQGLNKINLRVVQTAAPAEPAGEPRHLPTQAAKSLAKFAQALQEQPDYQQLGATIMRLSEHTVLPNTERAKDQAAESATTLPWSSPENDTSS